MVGGIYKITSLINDKFYIGSAMCFAKRKGLHLFHLRKNKHSNAKLQRHFNKYGESDLVFELIKLCDPDHLIKCEQYFIDYLNPYFNIAKIAGSTKGYRHTQATKDKFSAIHKGKPISAAHRQSISNKTKGVPKPTGFGEKVSIGNKGKKKSPEHILNMSLSQKGKKAPVKRILAMRNTVTRFHVNQYDINGKFIKQFFSSYDASKELNIPIKNIQRVCRGRYNSSYNFKFAYESRASI